MLSPIPGTILDRAVLVVLVAVAACGPPAPETPTAPPEATVDENQDLLRAWPVSRDAVGPVHFGMSPEDVMAVTGEDLGLPLEELTYPESCVYGRAPSWPDGLYLMFYDGEAARMDIDYGLGLRTPEGVGIGSSLDDLVAAYGSAAIVDRSKYGGEEDRTVEVVQTDEAGSGSGYVFEVTEGRVSSWRVGFAEQVYWVEGCS